MATTQATTATATAVIPAEAGTPAGGGPDREFTIKARSQRQLVVRHFLHNKVGMSGLVIFVLMLAFGFLGPLIHTRPYAQQNNNAHSVPPGVKGYILGSDEIGRDLLSGLMQGVERSMLMVVVFVGIALPVGLLIGAMSGYFGKWIDNVLMRIVDLIL